MEVRKILIAIDESEGAQRALQWTLEHMHKDGDVLALLYVIPRPQATVSYGAPPVDMLPTSSSDDQEQQALSAQQFIHDEFLPRLQGCSDDPEVHIVRSDLDADSVGNTICKRARDMNATAIVISSQARSKMQEFLLGSITNYVTQHSQQPVLVVQ